MSLCSIDLLVLYISGMDIHVRIDVTRTMHPMNGCILVDVDVLFIGLSPKPEGGISPKPSGMPGGGLLPFNTVGLQKLGRTMVRQESQNVQGEGASVPLRLVELARGEKINKDEGNETKRKEEKCKGRFGLTKVFSIFTFLRLS